MAQCLSGDGTVVFTLALYFNSVARADFGLTTQWLTGGATGVLTLLELESWDEHT